MTRTLIMTKPDQLYEEAEKALREARAKYAEKKAEEEPDLPGIG
jgi:hypothetical protein